jgi:hypothetical protein
MTVLEVEDEPMQFNTWVSHHTQYFYVKLRLCSSKFNRVVEGSPQWRLEKYMKWGKIIGKERSQACDIYEGSVTKVIETFVKRSMTKR